MNKSPLAPLFQSGELKRVKWSCLSFLLFQRGEQQRVVSAVPSAITLSSPFEKGGLRGICFRAILQPLNELRAAFT